MNRDKLAFAIAVAIRDAGEATPEEYLEVIEAELEQAGFRIVPEEPTEAMWEAGHKADSEGGYETWANGQFAPNATRIYAAMIAAAKGE